MRSSHIRATICVYEPAQHFAIDLAPHPPTFIPMVRLASLTGDRSRTITTLADAQIADTRVYRSASFNVSHPKIDISSGAVAHAVDQRALAVAPGRPFVHVLNPSRRPRWGSC